MAKLISIHTKVWTMFLALTLTPLVICLEMDSWCPSACRCNRTELYVDCSDAGLTIIPPNTPNDTASLDLSANPLGELAMLPHLKRLRLLRITRHSLYKLTFASLRHLHSLRILDLSDNLLQNITPDVAPPSLNTLILAGNLKLTFENNTQPILRSASLRTLDLSFCSIYHLPTGAFSSLPSLQHLVLSNNYISTLPPKLFYSLSALSSLDLSNNRLAPLQNTTFLHNPFLTSLNLSGNPWNARFILPRNESSLFYTPTAIRDSPILISPSLEYLDLSGCLLIHLSTVSLASLPKLRYLSLAKCGLRRINGVFDYLVYLETLDISENPLYSIGDLFKKNLRLTSFICTSCRFIFAFSFPKSASYLNLTGSNLRGILNSNLAQLPALTTLLLSRNELFYTDSEVFAWNPLLEEVELSYCKLVGLHPDTFLHNQNITKINLAGNELGMNKDSNNYFPPTTVVYLDLSNCNYQNISKKYFSGLHSLAHLNLSNNPLIGWEDGTFSEMSALQSLDVSRTYLTHLDPNSFIANRVLVSLFLSHVHLGPAFSMNSFLNNNDTSLQFINMPMLKELDLSNCGIYHLTKHMFSGTPALKKLSLSRNGLRSLDLKSIKEYLPNLTYLDLTDNPWRCDCGFADLRDWWVEQKMEPRRHWVICEEPENLRDRTWDAIDSCGDSVSKISKNLSEQDLAKEDDLKKIKTSQVTVKTDHTVNENNISKKSSTAMITTLVPVIKKFTKAVAKSTTTFPHPLIKISDDMKNSKPLPFPRPPPPRPITNKYLPIKRAVNGALLGFFSVVAVILLGSIFFLLVCHKRYERLSNSSRSETVAVWEL